MEKFKYDITVSVSIYNSNLKKLLCTLQSILNQKNISIQIIIGDDASSTSYEDEIKDYFKSKKYNDYIIYSFSENRGTVLNILESLKYAEGKYFKGISPGDCFYDANVLNKLYAYAEQNQSKVIFGVADTYSQKNKLQLTKNRILPRRCDLYQKSQYEQQIEYFICNDVPLGATYFLRTDIAFKYIKLIANRIKYAEDYSIGLMLEDGIELHYYSDHMIWYESDTGISTRTNERWTKALKTDLDELHNILIERSLKAKNYNLIKSQNRLHNISNKVKNRFLKYIVKTINYPKYPYYIIRGHRIKTSHTEGDLNSLKNILTEVDSFLKQEDK